MNLERDVVETLDWLSSHDIKFEFFNHSEGKTTVEASEALGVDKSSILKCLLLKNNSDNFVGIIVSGDHKISFKKAKLQLHDSYKLATPKEVKKITGHVIGGIPPICFLIHDIKCFVDIEVMKLNNVYGSAGTSTTGIKFSPLLFEKIGYKIVDIGTKIDTKYE